MQKETVKKFFGNLIKVVPVVEVLFQGAAGRNWTRNIFPWPWYPELWKGRQTISDPLYVLSFLCHKMVRPMVACLYFKALSSSTVCSQKPSCVTDAKRFTYKMELDIFDIKNK